MNFFQVWNMWTTYYLVFNYFGELRILRFPVMTDHKEEQDLELEALSSIYPEEFTRK